MATDKDLHKMNHPSKIKKNHTPTVKINKQTFTELMCDSCKSTNIKETIEGNVCGDCGLVLEGKKIVFYKPYFSDIQQYAKLGTTQVGNTREALFFHTSHPSNLA